MVLVSCCIYCRIHFFLLLASRLVFFFNFSGMENSPVDLVKGHMPNLQLTIYRSDVRGKDGVLAYPYSHIFSYESIKENSILFNIMKFLGIWGFVLIFLKDTYMPLSLSNKQVKVILLIWDPVQTKMLHKMAHIEFTQVLFSSPV